MPDPQDNSLQPCCCGLLRFHASTIVVTSILFLLPVLLLSLPGREISGSGTTGFWTTQYFHGLPFVFLERQSVEYSGTWANKIFTPGGKPKDIDFDAEAAKHMSQKFFDGTFGNSWVVRLISPSKSLGDFGTDEYEYLFDEFETSSIEECGFWSDGNRWPWMGSADGEAIRIHWIGLLIDGLLLLLTSYLFARLVEYRLSKRGSHFSFSLAELLVGICVAGVFFAWITSEYRRALKENNAVDELIAAVEITGGHLQGERRNGLPIMASELLDHRSSFSLLRTHLFRPVRFAEISIYSSDDPEESLDAFVEAVRNVDFPIRLDMRIDKQTLPTLKAISSLQTVTQLNIDFNFDLEWDETIDDYRDDIDLNFKLNFPSAEDVTLTLQSEIDYKKQIKPVLSMKNLKRLEIQYIDREIAAYLNSIAKDLPAETLVRFDSDVEKFELVPPLKLAPEFSW